MAGGVAGYRERRLEGKEIRRESTGVGTFAHRICEQVSEGGIGKGSTNDVYFFRLPF